MRLFERKRSDFTAIGKKRSFIMIGEKILKAANKLFPAPVHPFNLMNDKTMTYARWQYERGLDTIRLFLKKYTAQEMFEGKEVLDVGCGAGGKSLYYAANGAKFVYGVEILEKYRQEAEGLAGELGLSAKFSFVAADSARLPFEDNSIDTIIVNDAMEHVAEPQKTLTEMLRVVKPGGRIYVNFPPYHHPFGAHLSDAIYIPWVHLFFSEKTLINSYKNLVADKPDGKERIEFRISKRADGSEYFSYINRMTIKRFKSILRALDISPAYYKEEPLRSVLSFAARLPLLKELFVKMVVCVIEKPSQ
jgi:ubiquinone/menaquinone biosynthesis C-methylase UbiE